VRVSHARSIRHLEPERDSQNGPVTKVDMATARRIAGKISSRLVCGHYNTDLATHWALMGALEASL
jgi:hypothetical protein